MSAFSRLMCAEIMKLRRSQLAKLVWLVPILFVAAQFLYFDRPLLDFKELTPGLRATLDPLQVKLLVVLWGGFIHPVMLALIPAQVFRPEHRFKTWRHLQAMPLPRRHIFLAKTACTLLLTAIMLGLVGLLLLLERRIAGSLNPALALPYHARQMFQVLGWLWLGSLPVLAVYLWISERINSLAVPVVFGLVGLLLTISLTGQELNQPWRRDLIPWVLPYAAAERVIHTGHSQQEAHAAGAPFQPEPNVIRLPSGRKVVTHQNIPDEILFRPPDPTPTWMLGAFSAAAGMLLLGLAWLDSGRRRV